MNTRFSTCSSSFDFFMMFCLFVSLSFSIMSRFNNKRLFQRDFWRLWLTAAAVEDLTFSTAMRWLILCENLKKQRYLTFRIDVISKSNWNINILFDYNDIRFRKYVRMNRKSFVRLMNIVKNDFIFYSNSNRSQILVSQQLFVVFHKFNHDDIECDFKSSADLWDIFENHVFNCIKKVIIAFYRRRDEYIKWSNIRKRRRENMKNDARADFIKCVEKLDDIDIVLTQKFENKYNEKIFFNRKKRHEFLCYLRF